MVEVIGVKFNESNRTYNYAANGFTVKQGDIVLVDSRDVIKEATVSKSNFFIDDSTLTTPLKPIIRIATPEDMLIIKENAELSKNSFRVCKKLIEKHNLDMCLTRSSYSFDRSIAYFYYTAPTRVDFRELVKDLARELHNRVELRQIGEREACQMFGGIGLCGRAFCCHTFLNELSTISIKNAKKQKVTINKDKSCGPCGKLLCCYAFEADTYDELIAKTPAVGSTVKTKDGIATVVGSNLISGDLKLSFEEGGSIEIRHYDRDEVTLVHHKSTHEKKESKD